MPVPPPFPYLLAACLFISDDEHAARLALAEERSDPADTALGDSGSDPDETADDTDTDSGTDTAVADDGSGDYEGTFTLAVEGTLGDDTCVGTVSLVLATEADTTVAGSTECSYGGVYDLYGAQSGTIEGNHADGSATGAIEFGTGIVVADTWSASMTIGPPPRITATFEGTTTCQGTSCDYFGSFSADRVSQ